MKYLKATDEFRADTEEEAKAMINKYREEANEKGYEVTSVSYVKKEKKAKGEIVDEGFLVKISKTYDTFWD